MKQININPTICYCYNISRDVDLTATVSLCLILKHSICISLEVTCKDFLSDAKEQHDDNKRGLTVLWSSVPARTQG